MAVEISVVSRSYSTDISCTYTYFTDFRCFYLFIDVYNKCLIVKHLHIHEPSCNRLPSSAPWFEYMSGMRSDRGNINTAK